MNCYIRIAATQCSLGTWFVSGICVDTLHKGNTEDDDYDDDNDDDDDDNNNNNNNININNICPNQCMKREMSLCCGIKQYTQTEKLQQIGQI
jgi:hypothetical protein